jgi:endonuclease/exonuclease/phosphatase family metal-dependent hydrolase
LWRADDVRAVTYNVRGFRDGRKRVAAVVSELAPDVLLLQETGSRRDLGRFADDVGMRVAHDPWSPFRRRVKNAVLVAERWRFRSIELIRFPGARRWYPRGALVARAMAGGDAIWAVSVHFGLAGAERAAQAASLVDLVASLDGGLVIVGGDLNATPDLRAIARIAATLRDAWSLVGDGEGPTFPASAPAARIDYVFVGGAGTIVSATVGAEGASEASDHLPVVVDLRAESGPRAEEPSG